MAERSAGSRRPEYVLGHSEHELARLEFQAGVIGPITRGFFRDAGIAPGMRVLDVGSGAGDVAFIAAELIGPTGAVVGVDRAEAAVELARARAKDRGLAHVEFHAGDPAAMEFAAPFDAVLGRYVLQFQRAPEAMLKHLAARVRPGGIVVFHEIDWSGPKSSPPAPLYDQVCAWSLETMTRNGTETRMGTKLHATFVAAGLPVPTMRLTALLGGGSAAHDVIRLAAGLAVTLLPEMERLRVATAAELGPATLLDRMQAEAASGTSLYTGHYQVGAWCRIPG